jgi:hypothetical protein
MKLIGLSFSAGAGLCRVRLMGLAFSTGDGLFRIALPGLALCTGAGLLAIAAIGLVTDFWNGIDEGGNTVFLMGLTSTLVEGLMWIPDRSFTVLVMTEGGCG